MTSIIKPNTHNPIPIYPIKPISKEVFDVIAARPAPIVTKTHKPPSVHKFKKRINLVLITSNRTSFPSCLILVNKNNPKRVAQITTILQIIMPLKSSEGDNIAAVIAVAT